MAPVIDPADTRDISLLVSTLDIFDHVSDVLATNTPKSNARVAHLHLQAWSHLAAEQFNRLNRASIQLDQKLVYELLDQCNSLVDETIFRSMHTAQPYGALVALRDHWRHVSHADTVTKLTFSRQFESSEQIEKVDTISENPLQRKKTKLVETLMDTVPLLKTQYPDSGPVEDFTPSKKKRASPPYAVWNVAESLFEALLATKKCPCSCKRVHQYDTRLRLATHRNPQNPSLYPEFDIFLALDYTWQETKIQVTKKPAVKFEQDDRFNGGSQGKKKQLDISSIRLKAKRTKVKRLCQPLHDMKFWKSHLLKFEVEGSKLYHLKQIPPDMSLFHVDASGSTISFAEIIRSKGVCLTEKTKRIVAVLLGYAVLHLQGTQWMKPSWRPSEVVFYKSSSSIPLRPYIQISLADDPTDYSPRIAEAPNEDTNDSDNDDDDDDNFGFSHPFPCLVTLAIMLMELYFSRPFGKFAAASLDSDMDMDMIDSDGRYAIALQTFSKYAGANEFTEEYRRAIDKCLDLNIDHIDGIKLDEQGLRDVIYEEIVCRLENELEQGKWVDEKFIENLDNEAQRLDLANLGQPLPGRQRPGNVDTNIQPHLNIKGTMLSSATSRVFVPHASVGGSIMRGRYTKRMRPKRIQHFVGESIQQCFNYRTPRFFDDRTLEKDISPNAREDFLNWKQQILKVYDDFIQGSQAPVKIAILDTGIDLTHPDFASGLPNGKRIKGVKNFTNSGEYSREKNVHDVHDENGHGTHTAGLILDFAPDAELYVAKIARDEPGTPIIVADAINHAVNEWKADIISMSFGWPTREIQGYEILEQSIQKAYYKTLLFAAASNEGANQNRTFPARHAEVICIHASDANGEPLGFNPPHVSDDNNFATIGEAVESAWPTHLCNQGNDASIAYRTGTSFATPIAAGIAAFLLQYGKENLDEADNERLATSAGMRAVFRSIKVSKHGYDYVCLRLHPDNFFGRGRDLIKLDIQDILRQN